jgi:hypothetical protein
MQPLVSGYSNQAITFNWVPASITGIPVLYTIYYSQFNPDTDVNLPVLSVLARNVTTTAYSFTSFLKNCYFQFAVQAVNDVGKLSIVNVW